MAEILCRTFLVVLAKPMCLSKNILDSILMNNFWFLSGWGFCLVIAFWVVLGILVGKLNLGIFIGVTMPGLLFLFGVWNNLFSFFGFGVNGVGCQFLKIVGWHFFLSGVFFILLSGSLVPPATFTVGFSCLSGWLGRAWLVGFGCKYIVAGSLVPPATPG